MANYRPKSLDELNSLYDKSLNARNEIVKKASVLDAGNEKQESAFLPDEPDTPKEKTREQLAADEISDLVGDFVKSFGKEVPVKRANPSPVPTSGIRAVPAKASESDEAKNEAEAVDNKPRLIRNSERNNLFENYKKVMDDEDDYDFSEPRKAKKKKLFDKKGTAEEEVAENKNEENKSVSAPIILSETNKADAGNDTVNSEKAKDEYSIEGLVAIDKEDDDNNDKADLSKKSSAAKAVVMILLFITILLTTAVGAVKAFSGINSNKLFNEKYRIYTASNNYTALGINKGDLVIVENKAVDEGYIVAYEPNAYTYEFAKFESLLNDECFISDNGSGQKGVVYNRNIRGVVYKTVPVIGAIAATIISDFNTLAAVLVAVIVLLALIAGLAFRKKSKPVAEENEEAEETSTEHEEADRQEEAYESEEAPLPEKKKKKSKKEKKKAKKLRRSKHVEEDEVDEYAEDEYTDGEGNYDEGYDYDSFDADFSYLLNEDEAEAYNDSYNDYSTEEDDSDRQEEYDTEDNELSDGEKYIIADEEETEE